MTTREHKLLVVLGPTATGKTRVGVALARALGGEILSADSRQVYRRLDIGTGKDLEEYGSGSERVPVHLIDLVEPEQEYNLFRFQQDFCETFEQVHSRGKLPILVGGTGLYLEAVLEAYRLVEAPENQALREELAPLSQEQLQERLHSLQDHVHNTTDYTTRERLVRAIEIAQCTRDNPPQAMPPIDPLILGVRQDREKIYERIGTRLSQRIDQGMIQEAERLIAAGLSHERLDSLGLEYRFLSAYLRGEIKSRAELEEKLSRAIRNFARRQLSWFRRMERRGTVIHWLEGPDPQNALEIIQRHWQS